MTAHQTISFPVENMTCGGCAARVTKVLTAVPGAQDVRVNFAAGSAQFDAPDGRTVGDALSALRDAGYPAETQSAAFSVRGLSCASCVGRLQNALGGVAGVAAAEVNLASETARLSFVSGVTAVADLQDVAAQAGYPMTLAQGDAPLDRSAEKSEEAAQQYRAMMLAAALTLPVFILEMGGHLIPAWHHFIGRSIGHEASWMIQGLLTTLVLIGPGRGFFTNGFPALWRYAPNMNSLVAMGAGSAWAFSMVALWAPSLLPQGTRAVYFEAAAVIVTLILMGRWFEARAKGQTGAAIKGLIGLQPRTALIKDGAGWREIDVESLRVRDVFLLKPGARVPTDAKLLSGSGAVDESMLTGEPMPVLKAPGDALTGGSVNGHGSLTCEVTRTGQDTTLAQIIRMVQEAQSARLPIQALVDRVTLWFVPAVMAVALATLVAWLLIGPDPALSYALVACVSVLIIACPCAMGLATPTSIMVGTGRAAELGVLFRQGDALQSLADVQVIAVDKTGTLTRGQPMLTAFERFGERAADDILAEIAGLETFSEHPVAAAIVQAATDRSLVLPECLEVKAHAGRGVSGLVAGRAVAVGTADFMQEFGVSTGPVQDRVDALRTAGQTVFYAQSDGVLTALLGVSDPLRETSAQAIAAMQEQGLKVAMISGDAPGTAHAVAATLGIDTVIAGVLPEGKVAALDELRAAHGKTAFVGDGINDAPVLAQADVGIAIGTGTDVAIETADVVLMSGDLMGVVHALSLSRSTLRNIKQNLMWAFGYNIALIPVAAGVFFPLTGLLLSPGLAAGAMAFSSVFVLGNALRLRRAGAAV